MRALELQRREEERQSKLKSAAEAKAERQQKWEAMTEEEKEVFVQEEKIAKKQEWIKKQVGKFSRLLTPTLFVAPQKGITLKNAFVKPRDAPQITNCKHLQDPSSRCSTVLWYLLSLWCSVPWRQGGAARTCTGRWGGRWRRGWHRRRQNLRIRGEQP